MNVVCHQAVAEQPYAVLPAPLRKCLEIESPVFVAQEDVLTIVAPLGDVVWNALHDHTGHPRHWNVRIIAEFGGCPSSLLISPSSLLISPPSSLPSSLPHLSSLISPHLFLISSSSLPHLFISLSLISSSLSPSSLHLSPSSLHLSLPHLFISLSLISSSLSPSSLHLSLPHLFISLSLISPQYDSMVVSRCPTGIGREDLRPELAQLYLKVPRRFKGLRVENWA